MSVSVASCKTRDWRRGDIRLNIRAIQPSLKFPNEGIQCMLFPKSSEAYATDGQGGISLVVKRQFSKLKLGGRFPHPPHFDELSASKTKSRRYGGILCRNAKKLFHRVLQGLGSAELRHSHRLDLDGRTRPGVPARAAGACLRLEDTEACDRDLLALLEGVGNHRDYRLYCALSVSFCAADGCRYPLNQIHFICHMSLLYLY